MGQKWLEALFDLSFSLTQSSSRCVALVRSVALSILADSISNRKYTEVNTLRMIPRASSLDPIRCCSMIASALGHDVICPLHRDAVRCRRRVRVFLSRH